MKKISIANDHGGLELKQAIMKHFKGEYEFVDCGLYLGSSITYFSCASDFEIGVPFNLYMNSTLNSRGKYLIVNVALAVTTKEFDVSFSALLSI